MDGQLRLDALSTSIYFSGFLRSVWWGMLLLCPLGFYVTPQPSRTGANRGNQLKEHVEIRGGPGGEAHGCSEGGLTKTGKNYVPTAATQHSVHSAHNAHPAGATAGPAASSHHPWAPPHQPCCFKAPPGLDGLAMAVPPNTPTSAALCNAPTVAATPPATSPTDLCAWIATYSHP